MNASGMPKKMLKDVLDDGDDDVQDAKSMDTRQRLRASRIRKEFKLK